MEIINQMLQRKELIIQLSNFKDVVEKTAETLSPAQVANYVYDLVKTYNSFYQNNPWMTLEDENAKTIQTQISDLTAKTIKKSLHLLGINVKQNVNRKRDKSFCFAFKLYKV